MPVEFEIWLDNEIETLREVRNESNVFVWGKYSEAVRIRAMLLQIKQEFDKNRGGSDEQELQNNA